MLRCNIHQVLQGCDPRRGSCHRRPISWLFQAGREPLEHGRRRHGMVQTGSARPDDSQQADRYGEIGAPGMPVVWAFRTKKLHRPTCGQGASSPTLQAQAEGGMSKCRPGFKLEGGTMKSFVRFLAAAALTVAGATGALAQAKEWKEVRIGTEGAYPPYNNLNAKKELEGYEIDYANLLCEKMKVKCTWVVQDWDGIIPALLANKYDIIIAGMNATDERKKQVEFTAVYNKTPIWMVGPKATKGNDITPAALKGKAVGAQGSTIHANFLEKFYKDSNPRLYPTQEEANLDLINGRLDYIVADALALSDFLNGKGKDCCRLIAEVPRDAAIHGPGVAGAIRKADTALKALFDKAIAETLADGSNKKLEDKWFKLAATN
jgi:polar amino acid transport system substrate-binding protein